MMNGYSLAKVQLINEIYEIKITFIRSYYNGDFVFLW